MEMQNRRFSSLLQKTIPLLLLLAFPLATVAEEKRTPGNGNVSPIARPKAVTDQEWRQKLTPLQYEVTRQKGTEHAFTGRYWNSHEEGIYKCSNCGAPLFLSTNKFDSGTGWPSFDRPAKVQNVHIDKDHSLGMERDEVTCSHCGAHLGHVFDDGPKTTGKRYCINSASLDFNNCSLAAPVKKAPLP